MATAILSQFFRRLTRTMAAQTLADQSDRQLVERTLAGRDEVAFQAIVHRHGAMVYRVCWRVLQHAQDAEDAFQATFLVLAQKLRTLRKHASLASWLHGVARRVALKAKAQAAARRRHEHQASLPDTRPPDDVTWEELRSALDVELDRLPDKWRLPLILCYLEGRTQDEAAGQLGWSKSTLRRRLEEARAALACRLSGRGIVWPAALSAVLLSDCMARAAPAPGLIAKAIEAAAGVAAGKTPATAASAKVAALAQGVLKAMFISKLKIAGTSLSAAAVVVLAASLVTFPGWAVQPRQPVAVETIGIQDSKKDKDSATIAAADKAKAVAASGAKTPSRQQWGFTVQGLRMSISATGQDKAGNPEFQVAIGNVGEHDVTLNLGMMLANGKVQLPDHIRLNLTDAKGKTRELRFSDKRYPGIAGRVDDYVVPLRVGSVYTLKLPLSQFWSPGTEEFTLQLKPGKYQVSAQFEGGGADHDSGKFIMNFWKGKLQSNNLTLEESATRDVRRPEVKKDKTPEDFASHIKRLGRLPAELTKTKKSDAEIVTALFLASLKRAPAESERAAMLKHLQKAKDRTDKCRDILWALVNTREFLKLHGLDGNLAESLRLLNEFATEWDKKDEPQKKSGKKGP